MDVVHGLAGRLWGLFRAWVWPGPVLASVIVWVLAGVVPALAAAQHPASAGRALVFDGATVVDVEQGKLVPNQRVVITGRRIQAVGPASRVRLPTGARRVDARGKYLMPGLWDLHVHPWRLAPDFFYPLFIANGVTGIRDAHSPVPLDTLRHWRREILAGARVGPPRQLLSGLAIGDDNVCPRTGAHICGSRDDTVGAARRLVDSLEAAGADMLKMYGLSPTMYSVIAAEAQRQGLPFGGHAGRTFARGVTPLEASDYGASIVDHDVAQDCQNFVEEFAGFAQCMQTTAEHFRRNETWFVPTLLLGDYTSPVARRFIDTTLPAFWAGSLLHGNWLHAPADTAVARALAGGWPVDSASNMAVVRRFGLPLLAGTDAALGYIGATLPGFALHAELAAYVVGGLTPLEALQGATLNPAKMLHGTDSLGTVAPGKLADLVLLDADPLADITNTTTIRAVVANGRYFDRAALDRLIVKARTQLLVAPVAAWAGQKGTVLPVVDVQVDSALLADARYALSRDSAATRAWADSLLGALLVQRAPRVSWVLPRAIHALAKAGRVKDPAAYGRAWEDQPATKVSDSLHTELRHLVTATGGQVVLAPLELDLHVNASPGAGTGTGTGDVCADLSLQLVDSRTGQILWSSFQPEIGWQLTFSSGCGATPAAALAAAFAVAFPPNRRAP